MSLKDSIKNRLKALKDLPSAVYRAQQAANQREKVELKQFQKPATNSNSTIPVAPISTGPLELGLKGIGAAGKAFIERGRQQEEEVKRKQVELFMRQGLSRAEAERIPTFDPSGMIGSTSGIGPKAARIADKAFKKGVSPKNIEKIHKMGEAAFSKLPSLPGLGDDAIKLLPGKTIKVVEGDNFRMYGSGRQQGRAYSIRKMESELKEIADTRKTLQAEKKLEGEQFLKDLGQLIQKGIDKHKAGIRKQIGFERFIKEFGGQVVPRVKTKWGIKEWKNANIEQLKGALNDFRELEKNTNFLTEKQISGLRSLLSETFKYDDPAFIPQKVAKELLGQKKETMNGPLMRFVSNELIPSVDLKQEQPLLARIVNRADEAIQGAEKATEFRNQQFDELLTAAEKSRRLSLGEKTSRFVTPQNPEIFRAMSGQKVDLTKEEEQVVTYLKSFFEQVRKDLKLERTRQNYITHIEKPLMEKLITEGVGPAIKQMFKRRQTDIPNSVMLELDKIIGSEKFFKFAMERKGGLNPTTNLRKIINEYGSLYETKKALDNVLEEGQAITKLLLQPDSAKWATKFLQNLKGRGLDNAFRHGKMGWMTRVADQIVNVGYVKLLGLNPISPLKNIAAGEANQFIWLPFKQYISGKTRFATSPKKAIQLAKEVGILEGTFADYAIRGLGKLKKIESTMLLGQQAGEYEVRTTHFLAELTEAEWKSGRITPERVRAIKDNLAITQGVFTKVDSPLFVQTWYGRLMMQMNRWRITNAMLVRRLVTETIKEQKAGIRFGTNAQRLTKAVAAYGAGMYLSYEAAKAGHENAAKIAKSMAENLNSLVELPQAFIQMITDNPTYSVLKELSFTAQNLASYIAPGVEPPQKIEFNKGIEDSYLAPVEAVKDILGIEETTPSRRKNQSGLPGLNKSSSTSLPGLPGLSPKSNSLPRLPGL